MEAADEVVRGLGTVASLEGTRVRDARTSFRGVNCRLFEMIECNSARGSLVHLTAVAVFVGSGEDWLTECEAVGPMPSSDNPVCWVIEPWRFWISSFGGRPGGG
jgi:hypothetical protein